MQKKSRKVHSYEKNRSEKKTNFTGSKSTNHNFVLSLAPSKQIAISSESQVLGRTIRLDMQYPRPDRSTNANINSRQIYHRIVLILGFRSAAVDLDWI